MEEAEEIETFEEVPKPGTDLIRYENWKSLTEEFTKAIRVQKKARKEIEKMLTDQEYIAAKLEAHSEGLDHRAKFLRQREEQIQKNREHWSIEIRKLESSNEELLSLHEVQKRENDRLLKRIFELEDQLDCKQAMALETKARLDSVEELNRILSLKEQRSRNELQQVCNELINGWEGLRSRDFIGIKRIGDLDSLPFYGQLWENNFGTEATRRGKDLSAGGASEDKLLFKSVETVILWQRNIWDPSWKPFKITAVEGIPKEIIDEEDEKLRVLKSDHGDVFYDAVITALKEMQEYKPIDRNENRELWNYREGRKATLKEVVSYVLEQLKQQNQIKD